jgi:hypothetical protein
MEMWNSVESLRWLSNLLMWAALFFAILAAMATGVRYYVDSRAGELSSRAQLEREATLKSQVEVAQREQKEAREKLSKLEKNVKGRHLTLKQSDSLTTMARQVCHSLSTINVTAANSNHEAQLYGTEIVKALKAGGCDADLALPIPGLTPDVIGVHIGVRDPKNLPPEAIELSKMLTEIGVKFSISPIKPDFFPNVSFVLVIGAK